MTLLVTATTGGLMDLATVSLHIASLWPRPVTVIEADPDGGRLAARHDWDVRPGLVELAAARNSQQFVRHLVGQQLHFRQRGIWVSLRRTFSSKCSLGTLFVSVGPVENLLFDELARG